MESVPYRRGGRDRMTRTGLRRLGCAAALAVVCAVPVTPAGTAAAAPPRVPAVWPTPQSARTTPGFPLPSSVRLVADAAADPAAVGLVRRTLSSAGTRVVTGSGPKAAVYVDGAAAATALAALGVTGLE